MLKITVNGKETFEIDQSNNSTKVNGNAVSADISNVKGNIYHVLQNHQSYNVEVIDNAEDKKLLKVKVNGTIYDLEVKDKFDELLSKLGLSDLNSNKVSDLKAPMPGLVLSIEVNAGNEVKKGDALMILEAMKMENVIKASGDGVVKSIETKTGDAVEKGQLLIAFE